MAIVIETIRFKLLPEIDHSDFLRRDRKVHDGYMALRPGFRSREVSRSEDGEYLVIVHWDSAEDAEATISAFFGAPETQDFIAAVDVSTVSSGRYEVVRA
mgnify:CR=1 FL=1